MKKRSYDSAHLLKRIEKPVTYTLKSSYTWDFLLLKEAKARGHRVCAAGVSMKRYMNVL